MQIVEKIAKELKWPKDKLEITISLLDEGNTIPFIARYRKEMTGEMDEVILRNLLERLTYLRNLEQRKEEITNSIREQDKLTEELERAIKQSEVLQEVEDLYLPFRPKRRTRASIAKEKGLEALALLILEQKTRESLESLAKGFLNSELELETTEDALNGSSDIIAEMVAEDADLRKITRNLVWQKGSIISKAIDKDAISPYEMYYEYEEAIKRIPPHRILAMNRGEKEKALSIKISQPEEEILARIERKYIEEPTQEIRGFLENAFKDGNKRLTAPAIEREIRNELTDIGEEQAIKVFSKNLHSLLLQAPVKGSIVLALDPGYRTGCKLAVVDDTGKVLDVGVIFPHPPQSKIKEAKKTVNSLIDKWDVDIIAIGNGTASRESELMVSEILTQTEKNVQYIIVSEAGASVYSASKIAKEEFPEYDLSLRSAVSIARRLQDPLAELVKIEPKAVGVGQYQHDVTPKRLDESLQQVVESCVNSVGVDINTASGALLQYIAGLTKSTANGIVKYRDEIGKLTNRKQILEVPRLGKKTFEQCAGFIRVSEGDNPLDKTPVHPESYSVAIKLLKKLGYSLEDLNGDKLKEIQEDLKNVNIKEMAEFLEVGQPTLRDIVLELQRPGRDPREELPPPLFRTDVLTMEDLKAGSKDR